MLDLAEVPLISMMSYQHDLMVRPCINVTLGLFVCLSASLVTTTKAVYSLGKSSIIVVHANMCFNSECL